MASSSELTAADFQPVAVGALTAADFQPVHTSAPARPTALGSMARGFRDYGGPEMAGFVAGELAAPYATPLSGMVGATIGNVAKQVMTRKPKDMSVGEAALEPTLATAGAAAAPAIARGARAIMPRNLLKRALGNLEEIPGMREVFKRMGVSPTLADLTGSKAAGQAENLAGSIPTSSSLVKGAQEAQNEQLAKAFEKTMADLGPTGSRAATGKSAVEGITERFKAMQETAEGMRKNISTRARDEVVPATNYRQEAKRLAKNLRLVENPGKAELATIKRLDQIAAGPEGMPFESWYSTQTSVGSKAGDVNLLSSQERGIEKALFKAMQRDLEAWRPKNLDVAREVGAFKSFYKNNVVPFNESLPGRIAAGKINPEDAAARIFSRDGLTELQDAKRWAGGKLFLDLRNRWLAGVLEKSTDPQTGKFVMGNFRKAWNSIDREVKQRAFSATERRGLDDLAVLSERVGAKYTPAGGGSPSGTPLGQVPYFQGGSMLAGATGLTTAMATGHPVVAAASVAELLASYHGPRWLARMVTTPEGIDFLTSAYKIPAASEAGQTLLAGLGATTAGMIGGPRGR